MIYVDLRSLAHPRSKSTFSKPPDTMQRSPEFYHSQLGEISALMLGIDTLLCKTHFCRSASTSGSDQPQAKVMVMSHKDTLKRGQ